MSKRPAIEDDLRRGLSRREIAEKNGVSRGYVSQVAKLGGFPVIPRRGRFERQLTQDQIDDIRDRYANGDSPRRIAEDLGRHENTVRFWTIGRNARRADDMNGADLLKLAEQTWGGPSAAARHIGIAYRTWAALKAGTRDIPEYIRRSLIAHLHLDGAL